MRAFNKNTGLGMSSVYADMLRVFASNAEQKRLNAQRSASIDREKLFNADQRAQNRSFQDILDEMNPPSVGDIGNTSDSNNTGIGGSGGSSEYRTVTRRSI